MWSIHFIAAILLLLLHVMQSSNAKNLNVASGIANRQLTIEESRGSSVQTTTSSNVQKNCRICASPIESANSAVAKNPALIKSLPCGHGKNIHSECFQGVVKSLSSNAKCPLCQETKIFKQDEVVGARRLDDRDQVPLLSEDELEAIEKRWPRILAIGRAKMKCSNNLVMYVIACAHLVMIDDTDDVVSPIIREYRVDNHNFLSMQIRLDETMPKLHRFKNFYVLRDTDGHRSTIGMFFQRSLHFLNGANYTRNLHQINKQLEDLSRKDKSRKLALYPELVRYGPKYIDDNTIIIGTIYDAVTLLLIPSLDTQMLAETLHQMNSKFYQINLNVDEFLRTNYPNLVQYKKMGSLNSPEDSIENNVRLIMHPNIKSDIELYDLHKLNIGAQVIEHSVDKFITKKYGHCRILDLKMRNTSGRDITFYTAIAYTLNPNLLLDEEWKDEIQNQLRLLECEPRDAAPLPSSKSKHPRISYTAARIRHRAARIRHRAAEIKHRITDTLPLGY